jgi:hypothetical protein
MLEEEESKLELELTVPGELVPGELERPSLPELLESSVPPETLELLSSGEITCGSEQVTNAKPAMASNNNLLDWNIQNLLAISKLDSYNIQTFWQV